MSLLQVKNLVVEFPSRHGTLRALDDISFDIAPGEILGVVGESGAGKSLTGAAIIGLLEPPGRVASGQILLEGQRIDHLNNDEMRHIRGRKIGAIFQDPLTSLNPLYSIGRQLTETILAHLPVTPQEARQRAIQLLKASGVDTKTLTTINVLDDAEIRQGIKEYSNWPTIPQLYVKGEFIGGSDIMTEMYESGELPKVLGA